MESRSQRARRLARRVERQGSLPDERVGWASLGSVWLHLAFFGALALLRPLEEPGARDPRLAVVRVEARPEPGSPAHAPADPHRQRPSAGPGSVSPEDPPEEPSPARLDRFARTRADHGVEAPPDRIDAISAHHTRSDAPRTAPITSRRDGLPTPVSHGDTEKSSSPTWERVPGDRDAALGNRSDGDRAPIPVGGGGGGERRDGAGPGSPGVGDGTNPGGAARGARGGLAVGSSGGWGAEAVAGATEGPDPRVAGERPGWWDPLVVRWSSPPSTPGPAVAARDEGSARAVGVAKVDRALQRAETGGTEVASAEVAPLPTEPGEAPGTRRRIAGPGTADPVEELRLALGFGPLDREKLAPRPEWAGRQYEEGLADSSPQTALGDADIAWQTSLSTEGTPLGAYVQRVEELIAARWGAADLDTHSRAVGVQGDVTVRFVVHPDGRTTDVSVVRSSGNIVLDDLAADAIPPRLARFPKDLEKEPYVHELTLHYRNPSITP